MDYKSFEDNYTSTTAAVVGKIQLSDDAFAIGQLLVSLINKIEQVRLR